MKLKVCFRYDTYYHVDGELLAVFPDWHDTDDYKEMVCLPFKFLKSLSGKEEETLFDCHTTCDAEYFYHDTKPITDRQLIEKCLRAVEQFETHGEEKIELVLVDDI